MSALEESSRLSTARVDNLRTPDLLHAMQTRSQLRHRPVVPVVCATSPSIVSQTPNGCKSHRAPFAGQRLDKVSIPLYTVSMMYGAYNFQGFYTMTRIRQV